MIIGKIKNRINKKIDEYLYTLARNSSWYKEEMFLDCEKFWNYHTFNTEVVNLGTTSAVHAFNYSDIDIKAANWALSRNPILGDYMILKNYYSFLKPHGSTVILSLCPFSALAGCYDTFDDRYYTILYPTSIPNFSYNKQQKIKAIKNNPLCKYPYVNLRADLKAKISKRKSQKTIQPEEWFANNAKGWIDGWLKEFSLKNLSAPLSLKNRDSIEDATNILKEMIGFCKERDINPIVLYPPMYHSLADYFTQEVQQNLITPIEELCKQESVKFINYMSDEHFSYDRSFFSDCFNMSNAGSLVFTKYILKDIGLI